MPRLGSSAIFRLGDFPAAQSFSILVNIDSAHGGTLLSPPIGIAIDPSE
jgi:hypothetical protein